MGMDTEITPSWHRSREGVLHLAIRKDTIADGTILQGVCGTWFATSGAFAGSMAVPLASADPACLASALDVS
ncbi:hypothetical protein ATK30_0329 [Amycolatopsis echigonensis]|uniref:Uncharacterized protein n=1 Tax=Amycolatopsis echigonensis TaxID=2576905 RepID=A0A2N3X295_9PSEU|nr:hypothetical protein [Amycolatopsis niigatensis]PKW00236.1 hypothetical protein ATK30_0329 [Amycolatopsis niigatensis]